MKSSQTFKFAMWAAIVYAYCMLWAFIIYRPWLLITYFVISLGVAICAYCMMRSAQKQGL